MINCAIYPRKSKQIEDSDSMDAQIYMCKSWLDNKYGKGNYNVNVYDGDYGITGHETRKRKDFQRMMADVKEGKIKLVLVQRYDRLARNTRDFCNIFYEMERAGCDLVSVSQQIDTSTPYGKKFMYDQASMAELEWALCSERRKDVNRYARITGRCNVATRLLPVGYKRIVVDGIGRMVIDEETVDRVHFVFDRYEQLSNYWRVAKEYNERYGTMVSISTIKHMIHHRAYIGEVRDNPNFCEPIIEKERWLKLQERKPAIRAKNADAPESIFVGLIHCPTCGRLTRAQTKTKSIHKYKYYLCPWSTVSACTNTHVKSQMVIEKKLIAYINSQLDKEQEVTIELGEPKEQPKVDVSKYKAQLNRLNSLYVKGRLEEADYEKQYNELTELINKWENLPKQDHATYQSVFAGGWEDVYNSFDNLHKRLFWKASLGEILVNEDWDIIGVRFN